MRAAVLLFTPVLLASCMDTSPFQVPIDVLADDITPALSLVADDTSLYWTARERDGSGFVWRLRKDGSERPVKMVRGPQDLSGHIAVDRKRVYFTDRTLLNGPAGEGQVVGLDKQAEEIGMNDPSWVTVASLHVPYSCGVAVNEDYVFWLQFDWSDPTTSSGARATLLRAAKEGAPGAMTTVSQHVTIGGVPPSPSNCGLLATATSLYWLHEEPDKVTVRGYDVATENGAPTVVAEAGLATPRAYGQEPGIAIDPGDPTTIYFAAPSASNDGERAGVRSTKAQGCVSCATVLVAASERPAAFAVDGDVVYWTVAFDDSAQPAKGDGKLMRARMPSGTTGVEDVTELAQGEVRGLALDSDFVYVGVGNKILRLRR
ncbi:MAG: hypothetical protein HY903_19935 [Deltaproteobacteria bacterium]|nr:hypothetical protein [Deltaproteobacteria bacterium]